MGNISSTYHPANSPSIDQIAVEERCSRFQSRSIKGETKVAGLKMAMRMIDLTTLEGKDSEGKVKQLCYKAMHPHDAVPGIPQVAAVCVYPTMVKTARKALKGSDIHVASVATAFPSGLAPLKVKLDDTRFAVSEGADEIDMVISRGKFLQGEYNFVFDEIAAIKEVCGKAHLKVILETGELSTLDNVRRACNVRGHSRLLLRNRNSDWHETRRRNCHFKISTSLPRNVARNLGRSLDESRNVPLWRIQTSQRYPYAIG
jgi:deoxyribose-phosphate aldolase